MAILASTSSSTLSISKDSYSLSLSASTSSLDIHTVSFNSSTIFGSKRKSGKIQQTHFSNYPGVTMKALRDHLGLAEELKTNKLERVVETEDGSDLFEDMKHRFLSFKKDKYLKNLEHYQNLAKAQAPKFLVIGCADSRVCPSTILGFQPGEAFMVRNIANLVPPFESGPSETNAALEFSVNSLEVKNILVVGHSCCGGIRALMSMNDEVDKSFIQSWVVNGNDARLWTKAAASKLSFDHNANTVRRNQSIEDNLKEKHGRISVKNHLLWS
ncbi:hypothetical protein M0R45_002072 [Rubus argutus]|uniref:Carbonic anhydrase n=1 Tax=Rubus argutus TaxID=59490 RepID=A0AAW1VK25_RUBAR